MHSILTRNNMDTRVVYCCFLFFGVLHLAQLRSIDQIIEDVGIDFEKNFTGPTDRLPSRVWFDYEVRGRKEELVKLQLDLVMTKELWDTVIDTEDALPSRGKRNAVKDQTRLWPRRIPYIMNEEYSCSDKYKLLMAMDHWEEHTCLKFVEANTSKDFDIIEFVPIDYGCESLLGRMQGRQPISLAKACMYKEVIVHEIGHALGLYHEHMRHDRNDYVAIHYQNINETHHRQFDKLKKFQYNGYDKPYDYESVMHYGKLFFSLNRSAELLTIEPKDEAYLDVIGEAPSLSFYDVKIVNEMYKCSEGCMGRTCPGNGFLGKNCQCYCKGKEAYDIVLCDLGEKCGKPNISLEEYIVFTHNYENEILSWDVDTYPDGTHFIVEHKNISCGYSSSTFNCNDEQWEGEVPPCEKACIVEDFDDTYTVTNESEEINPGVQIPSRAEIGVVCRNRRQDGDFQEEIIKCSDGIWDRKISDIVCKKEHPFCTMVTNAQITGSFEERFQITCLEGYDMELQGEAVDKFNCTWDGVWKPFTPSCKPASCLIPAEDNPVGSLFDENGNELLRGSETKHGSDVTLICPKGHVPDEITFSCRYGKLDTGTTPKCVYVTCPTPAVEQVAYMPMQNVYQYKDVVQIGRCRGLLAFEGSRQLQCLKDGTWSGTASCKPFCADGEVIFEDVQNQEFRDTVHYRKHGLSSYAACKRKCLRYRRFLCLSFVFGREKGRRYCRIHRQSPVEFPLLIQRRLFWTMGVRKCLRK